MSSGKTIVLQAIVKRLHAPEATGDSTPTGWHLSDVVIDTISPQNIQQPNSEIQQIIFYLYGYSRHILRKLIFMKTVAPEPVYIHKMELYFRLINYECIQKTK